MPNPIAFRPLGSLPFGAADPGPRRSAPIPSGVVATVALGVVALGGLRPSRALPVGPPAGRGPLGSLIVGGFRPSPAPTTGLLYRVYGNGGLGGPVDYDHPLAAVPALTWPSPPLSPGSDWTFAVRAFDPATGLEDLNTDARVRVVVGLDGSDRSNVPGSPSGLTARATAGGTAAVAWSALNASGPSAPQGFRVWLAAGSTVDFAAPPALDVAATPAKVSYRVTLSGLADGQAYAVACRAYLGAADDGNSGVVTLIGDAAGPPAVDTLTGTATAAA